MPKLLITDDDLHLRKLVLTYAQLEGFQCTEAENGFEALEKLRGDAFDLMILDIMMPHMDGFETLGELRKYSQVPVIMLTARGEEYDKLLGFNLGADDYLPKPFSPKELMARVRAVLGRAGRHKSDALCCGVLRMEPSSRTATLGGEPLSLTLKEYDLLLALMQNAHIVLSREHLLQMVWGYDYVGDARTVDTHIKTLRERLGAHRSMMALILLSVGFLWFGQIFLFEQNYLNAAMNEVETRLEPVMEELKTVDLAENTEILSYLSTTANGKMMLTNESGKLLEMYTYGHPMDLEEAEKGSSTWRTIRDSNEYQSLLLGEQYKKVEKVKGTPVSFEVGIPILYQGERAYVVFYRLMNEAGTVLNVNRRQLVWLSILLTGVAAVFAAFLASRFTRPIREVKRAVDQLAEGDLTAVPQLTLEDEIGQLAHSVEQLGQALQRVDILRKEVIANISHELRSPLSLISGYAEMVRDISFQDDQKREEDLNLIIHEARRMSEMVSDILDYSQFQAGYMKLKKEPYNLCDIVESEVTHCIPTATENGLSISLHHLPQTVPILADALKLTQVIRNLLYNAINHTEGGTVITVSVTQEQQQCRVAVANPGTPIPKEEQMLIWERYQRSQHQGGRRQGTGLGLSIVSSILKAHEMPYGVECADGFTIFWFSIPINKQGDMLI